MGVPKFFRYISERYPCLSELIRENQVPEFDNLYLDMNGIIHNCSHPNDSDVFFRITEEKIFSDIFHYLEFLFRMIRPQKLFFIAVDGVAPRAKMNQQRGRRFRSAHEAKEQAEQAEQKGHVLPTEARFDSNCITPGTSFMARLQKAMEHFIKVKISTNPLWKHCKVILSGHETPGEGEHKIMEYIRHAKASPGFDPNTRHCLYGLDADLVMLGLCTHEKHFSLLREEVKFGKTENKTSMVEETKFYLLHLTLMMEYLELEFAPIRDKLSFNFDMNKLIDDWVLMGYMVGNDFIPHLPHLHINENALPTLFQAYMDVLPTLDGYINEGGILNLPRLEVFMERLTKFDRDIFLEHYTDLQYFKLKRGPDDTEAFDVTIEEIKAEISDDYDLSALTRATEDMFLDDDDDRSTPGDIENDPEFFEKEFAAYKRNYYITKMGYHEFNEEVRAEQAECYIRALQWTLLYYYRGVPSWAWFYPHHYAPFISDVHDFKHFSIEFELGKPFLPFQQLLSVLPAASRDHLPSAYHKLMMDPNSPVSDFYPERFDTDLNGKQQAWEAVVLIPFIDEKRLLRAMEPCDAFLTDEEKERNVHGPMLFFQYYANGPLPALPANYGFDSIEQLKVKEIHIYREELRVPADKLVLGPSKGAILDGYVKGFPTFRHLQYHGLLKELRIKVFNYPSRNPSMVVVLDHPQEKVRPTEQIAEDLLGRVVYVSWPHLTEAKVVKVSDATNVYEKDQGRRENNSKFFDSCVRSIVEHHNNRLGIDLGKIHQLIHVRACVGSEYVLRDERYVLNKLWSNAESMYPAQAIVTDLREVFKTLRPYQELNEMFPEDCVVFLRGTQFYGSMGRIVNVTAGHKRIKARFEVYNEPDLGPVVDVNERAKNHYMGTQDAASMIGISPNLLSRLSSTILIVPGGRRSVNTDERGKMNIGLQLRMHTQNEETVGYTKKANKTWMFSEKAIKLIKDYYEKVPHLFGRLEHFGKCDNLFEEEMFGKNKDDEISLKELVAWISSQDHVKAEKRSCGTKTLEPAALEELLKVLDDYKNEHPLMQTMFVHAKHLFKPGMKQAKNIDHQANFELLDRIIVAKNTEVVPLGYQGTIVGIHFARDPNPVRQESASKEDMYFDILLDTECHNGVKIFGLEKTAKRVVRLAEGAVLNITFGRAEKEYKLADPFQPIMLPAEEFLFEGKKQSKTQQNYEAVRIAPLKPPPTAESIKQRLSERIEKKNPMKAFVMANQKPREDNEPNLQSTCDFEQTWNKLRETAQVGTTSEKGDIKSFLVTASNTSQLETKERQIAGAQAGVEIADNNGTQVETTSDPTNVLKMILKIRNNASETDQNNLTVMNTDNLDTEKNILDILVKAQENNSPALPHRLSIPTPKNLPEPPKSWRSQSKMLNNAQCVKETQQLNNANACTQHLPPQKSQPFARPTQPLKYQPPFGQMRPQHSHVRMHPPPNAHFRGFAPMPRYQRNTAMYPHPGLPQQQNLSQRPQIYRTPPPPPAPFGYQQHGPNGPQNLSFNRSTPAGTGAFVPLQAIINAKNRNVGTSSNKQSNNYQPRTKQQQAPPVSAATVFAKKNAELRQTVEQKHEEATQGFASFLATAQAPVAKLPSQDNEVVPATQCTSDLTEKCKMINSCAQQPRPRQMRIAAKFSQVE